MTNALLREAVPSVRAGPPRKVLGLHKVAEMITEHADADLNRNKEVVLRFMRLMDGAPSDLDVLDEVLASDLRLQIGASHMDRTQTKDLIRAFYAAFPDYTHTPDEILAVGDRVVLYNEPRDPHR